MNVVEISDDKKAEFPQYYGQNIWPRSQEEGVEGFEEAFKALGR